MNQKEIEDFLKIVKGRKITWSNWPKGDYFVPNGSIIYKNGEYNMLGTEYNANKSYGKYWMVKSGFEVSESGNKWVLIKDFEYELEQL